MIEQFEARSNLPPNQELADLRQHLLEAYYVVSEFAFDASDRDEREKGLHLKQALSDVLHNDDASDEDMYSALGYALAWVNGDCFEKPPAWAKLFAEPICEPRDPSGSNWTILAAEVVR
jgi:hypothetical protein